VLAVAIPALGWLFSHVVPERMGTIILSAFVAHTAWHWLLDRGAVLGQYHIEAPVVDAAFLAAVARGLAVTVAAVALGWAAHALVARWRSAPRLGLDNTPTVPTE
jgi:hypothetical protein